MGATTNWTKVHDDDDYIRAGHSGLIEKIYTFKMAASYATGGDTVTPATDISLATGDTIVDCVIIENQGLHTTDLAKYDFANNKVLLYTIATSHAEVSNASDNSAETYRAHFWVQRG